MDARELAGLLRRCTAAKSLTQGKLVHQKAIALGLNATLPLPKTLINFYLSFHLLRSARRVFDAVSDPSDVTLWNALLAAYSKNRSPAEALQLFDHLRLSLLAKPDSYTYPSVLKACGALRIAERGERIHADVVKSGFCSDIVVASSLVGMYAKCGRFGSAINLFDEMGERDVACWNTVISCYYQDGQPSKALEVSEAMRDCGFEPNSVTFTTVFSACARLSDLTAGRRIHEDLVRSGIELDGFVGSAIVDMYGKCGCLGTARDVFEQIPVKTVVAWNSMLGGYSLKGDSYSCLDLFQRMNEEGMKPTTTTISSLLIACSRTSGLRHGKFIHGYILRNHIDSDMFVDSSLLDLYFKCGEVGYAEYAFKDMSKANLVLWNVMISGYVTVGLYFKALDAFHEMRVYDVTPDAITFMGVLSACSQLSALQQGKDIHNQISDHGFETNEIVMSALLDMYAKCGAVREARYVFDRMLTKDAVSWTSMITAYGSHGQARVALELFHEMQNSGAKPDSVTFLAVLSACSHGGLVDEGYHYFNQMKSDYEIKPTMEHYSCLIDLLGRAGRLHKAYNILQEMHDVKPDAGLLGSLFSACSLHKDLDLGEKVARILIEMYPDDHSTYVVLSNMFASVGRWDEACKVRAEMEERGLRRNPGCSWIEVDKKVHQGYLED